MVDGDVHPRAIDVFSHYYRQLESGVTGVIVEDDIEPVVGLPSLSAVDIDEEQAREALSATVVVKLNGGLGTSMGMARAKSLLTVRDQHTFLDVIAQQVFAVRTRYGVKLPLLFMNSFRTHDDTLAALGEHPGLAVDDLPMDFIQNREPKLLADDLSPVEWPADPTLEWCPPGHGDLYTALETSGTLRALLDSGYRYASVSNADNLGAAPNATMAGWFASSAAPYAAEVCRRTPADRKGGHLVRRRSDGRLVLRETAQIRAEDADVAADIDRHPYFHTNNLWFDLRVLATTLAERDGVLGLPLIRNDKTVDPSDPTSPGVVQVETAMGAAVEVFPGARAIEVDRSRFLPVKTTNDLLVMRSDVYVLGDDGILSTQLDRIPMVDLDRQHYSSIAKFDRRFPAGPPSLRQAESLTVHGDWTFGEGVVVLGNGLLDGGRGEVAAGARIGDSA
ncbi:MAG: UTP--glucose-1-phosphate uridylyltransferase [Nocardioidaceae bacterium]|nr:UTP--glucose-1-phosphate uridylyltransferase [Nocardioidaceae bacterium]